MKYYLYLFLVLALLGLPAIASAELVPCGTGSDPCTFDHLLVLANGVINFALDLVIPLATISFAFAGFKYITSGSEKGSSEAKEIIKYTIGGIVLAVGAWLIINTILNVLGVSSDFIPLQQR